MKYYALPGKRLFPIIFKRPAKLVVEFPEIPKEEKSENSAKVNPEWVDAGPEKDIHFLGYPPGVNIGPPPKQK
jgi:hypothetical protein